MDLKTDLLKNVLTTECDLPKSGELAHYRYTSGSILVLCGTMLSFLHQESPLETTFKSDLYFSLHHETFISWNINDMFRRVFDPEGFA